jgi:archaellum component FlaG (FlaF/FlaG flagellin family)
MTEPARSMGLAACAARAAGMVTCLVFGVALTPGTAVAAFSGLDQAATQYSAASLAAPADNPTHITMVCHPQTQARTITVKNYGNVLKANAHELKIFVDTSPFPLYTGDLQPTGQTVVTLPFLPGSWRAEITGQYRVPGSTNVWTSPALQRALACGR